MDSYARIMSAASLCISIAAMATTLAKTIWDMKRAQPKLDVVASPCLIAGVSPDPVQCLGVKARNRQGVPIAVAGAGLAYGRGRKMLRIWWNNSGPSGTTIPAAIPAGDSGSWAFDVNQIRDGLRQKGLKGTIKLRPFCLDALDLYHEGKAIAFPLD